MGNFIEIVGTLLGIVLVVFGVVEGLRKNYSEATYWLVFALLVMP